VVEGAPLTAGGDDADDYRVEVFQDFNGWYAESRESDFAETTVSNGVARRAIAAFMRFAIDFDS
jgi:hypothetical protein